MNRRILIVAAVLGGAALLYWALRRRPSPSMEEVPPPASMLFSPKNPSNTGPDGVLRSETPTPPSEIPMPEAILPEAPPQPARKKR